MPTEPNPPKVFISYSHDSQEHFDCVLRLSDTLREWGIDCHIDQYELAPADWLRWMERRIREADFVLVVCTATYRRRFNGEEEPGKGLGVRHEGGVISAELYNRQTETAKFIPVIFSIADSAHIPSVMQNTNRHALNMEQLETDRGFENLYRQLTSQPRVIPKPLGKIRPLPPINRREDFDEPEIEEISDEVIARLIAKPLIANPPKPKIVEPSNPKLIHQNFTEDLGNGIKLEMIAIPGGSFLMGSEDFTNTKPVHPVKLSPFHIGKFQVTQQQWREVMKTNPSQFKGDTLPVESVSWQDAASFCEKLSKQAGKEYRLPTEAEWEYACLAGSTGKYCFGDDEPLLKDYAWYYENSVSQFGDDDPLLKDYAWYDENSDSKTHPVGEKKPNNWGLHDMHGNVWEWCQDWYSSGYYAQLRKKGEAVNPQGPANGNSRALRGGAWGGYRDNARAVFRYGSHPADRDYDFGFRVVVSCPHSS